MLDTKSRPCTYHNKLEPYTFHHLTPKPETRASPHLLLQILLDGTTAAGRLLLYRTRG